MFKDIKAVIFDVDGTLVDSMWIWREVDIEFLGRRGIELPENLQKGIEGLSYTETAIFFKERFKLPDSVDEIKEEWRLMADDFYNNRIKLKSGADSFVKRLFDMGYKLGIATSNSRELVETLLKSHQLDKYFHIVRTSCEVPRGKPFPDVYLKASEDLGIKPEACLVFEDTVAGVTAAHTAGMRVCAVYDEFSEESKENILEMAIGYIYSYEEVEAELKRMARIAKTL